MVISMLQWFSLKSSHPHLLPQSPKVCSLYLCLFCCLAYRVIVTIFLNSLYICFNIILHCVYVTQLSYPFICRWTSRLLPCSSYCKQCCDEHWGTRVSFNSGFLGLYAQQWDCWVVWQFNFQFFKESSHCSP